ncbi:MAG: hypothetical protein KA735_01770 [Burkholderiaceae bacterium]|nr:hypothetical protein [Burkholderiaceae bacterium]
MEQKKAPGHTGTSQDKSSPMKDKHAQPHEQHKDQGQASTKHAPAKGAEKH